MGKIIAVLDFVIRFQQGEKPVNTVLSFGQNALIYVFAVYGVVLIIKELRAMFKKDGKD